jgi:hypothetical protein
VLAAVAGNPPRFQAFSLDAGKLGDWPMGGGIDRAHLACSLTGALCAAIAEAGKGRVLRLFDTRAGERWRTALAHEGGGMPRVVVAAGGKVIIASERAAAGWRIRAWDGAGKALWQAPVAGPLVDFRVSWSGKRIAAVTEDGYIVYFDADVIAPKKPEAGKS